MTTTKSFDLINRLTSISSTASGSAVTSSTYQYNSANQRVRNTQADGSYWIYEYDPLGHVRVGRKFWSDGTPVAGQQFEYAHDDIGNRSATKAGGDENGSNLRSATYSANALNQYSSRTVPGAVDVMGISLSTSATVNTLPPSYRRGEYFRKELAVANASNPVWQTVDVAAPSETTVTGGVYVPKTPEQFGYDPDGNMTNDARWSLVWDSENRLLSMEPSGTVSVPSDAKRKLEFSYDSKGRRIRKAAWKWENNAWSMVLSNLFVYDGWNLIAELNATNRNVIRSYLWGQDLSGSLQGAGGVGGLIAVTDTANGSHFAAYDGNGNVMALLNAANSTVSALYEYGPFGEVVRATGPMAKANPTRFSTKYQDDESDLLYYGYRYYNGSTGRWFNRDPILERGGNNLYRFVANDPLRFYDLLGNLEVIFAGSGLLPLRVSVVPTLTVSDVCHGGPLQFKVSFDADYEDNGNKWMDQAGAWFTYEGAQTPIANFQDDPMRWDVLYIKNLPACPTGRQSGSVAFAAGERDDGQVLTIIFDWHYRCDCKCNEAEPFRPSYTYFVFPPLKPPPPPRRINSLFR